jgi:hypothetical protein
VSLERKFPAGVEILWDDMSTVRRKLHKQVFRSFEMGDQLAARKRVRIAPVAGRHGIEINVEVPGGN